MPQILKRFSSGIEGLDEITGGGLIADSTYIIQGHPGSGKTIFANQIAFHQAARGASVLYVTLLAESHERLFAFLSTLQFYDPSKLGRGVTYVSAFTTMEQEGLDGVIKLLRREIPRQKATLLVLDGLLNAREKAANTLEMKKFIAELQSHASFVNCTALLLTSARFEESSPEYTMVDGVIELREEEYGVRTMRRLRVRKSRGSAASGGLHQYMIRESGIALYPRLEAHLATPSVPDEQSLARTSCGLQRVDEMLSGGLPVASTTVVIGPSGCGKTSWGLNFLCASTSQEPGLHYGFYETQPRLQRKAKAIGLDMDPLIASGALTLEWRPPVERMADVIGHDLLKRVTQLGAKRLFIDGLGAIERGMLTTGRIVPWFSALVNELRARGVTVLVSAEANNLFDPAPTLPAPEMLSVVDNIVLMRFVEMEARIHRVFSMVKVRDSAFDPMLHDFNITDQGIVVTERLLGKDLTNDLPSPTGRPA
ncbi:ATPase domain-containing protein [Pseudoroseomonas globiformis]|uniref:non-specific serine/threonine protein kinase n=1 Tax=Teichococcus globiformis TaxID=2307229 RepID=A0ABV7G261_9PROT